MTINPAPTLKFNIDASGHARTISLDGQELSTVRALRVDCSAGTIPIVVLELYADLDGEIPGDVELIPERRTTVSSVRGAALLWKRLEWFDRLCLLAAVLCLAGGGWSLVDGDVTRALAFSASLMGFVLMVTKQDRDS